jgi:hypothetical protein
LNDYLLERKREMEERLPITGAASIAPIPFGLLPIPMKGCKLTASSDVTYAPDRVLAATDMQTAVLNYTLGACHQSRQPDVGACKIEH